MATKTQAMGPRIEKKIAEKIEEWFDIYGPARIVTVMWAIAEERASDQTLPLPDSAPDWSEIRDTLDDASDRIRRYEG